MKLSKKYTKDIISQFYTIFFVYKYVKGEKYEFG